MVYQAFYCCYSTGKQVASSDPVEIDRDCVGTVALDVLRAKDDFFGLVDSEGTTLQFMREDEHVWMEVPAPAEQASYGKSITMDALKALLASLPPTFSHDSFPGMVRGSWQ
ncbi:MAG: hypothetical protein AAGA29_08975 [Planctomycetota bacterium]